MIVICGIFLVITTAVVQIQHSRIVIDEQLSLRAARDIVRSCQLVALSQQRYPATLRDLPPTTTPLAPTDLIGDGAQARKHGYIFSYRRLDDGTGFTLSLDPQVAQQTGGRHFYTDQDGQMHQNAQGPATGDDPVTP